MTEKGLIERKCPKCQSSDVVKEVGVIRGRPSGAFSMKDFEVNMFICGKCNYIEFYYKEKNLWK